MKCNFCNEDMQDGMKFCPSCGAVASAEVNSTEENEQKQAQQAVENSQPTQSYNYGEQPQAQQGFNQQNAYYGQQGPHINGTTYLVLSILATLLCCLPLGIVAIVYAAKINSLQATGDHMGAQEAAKKAKTFIIISAITAIVISIFYIIAIFSGVYPIY